MSKRSTVLQLLNVIDEWSLALDQGNDIDCIYFDFMKAFDTVAHKRLHNKLKAYSLSETVIKWIMDFLSNRRQRVIVNGASSSWRIVTSGIPQGSVLGPLLFIIFINDIVEQISSSIYLFADDTKLFRAITSNHDNTLLQSDIDKLVEWSNTWLLSFHPDKCKTMHVGNQDNVYTYHLMAKSTMHELQCVTQEKDIGVIFDAQLEFDKHINAKINKANAIFAMIRRSYKFLNMEIFLHLYKALVRSNIEYANSVWCPYKMKYIESVENVQRRATRTIPELKGLSYGERLQKLKLPTLVYRRLRGDMIETFKMINGYYDSRVIPKFVFRDSDMLRGHSKMLLKVRFNKKLRSYSFTQRIINIWNSLPEGLVSAPSVNSFKNRLDKLWSNQQVKYDFKATLQYSNYYKFNINEELDIEDP